MLSSTPTLDAELTRAGLDIDGERLVVALVEARDQHLLLAGTPGVPLTEAEVHVLDEFSGVTDDRSAVEVERAATAARIADQYLTAYSTRDVARMLGKDPSRIRHLARDRHLYALPSTPGRGLRFPAWQFTDDGPQIAGLDQVLPALRRGLHPLQVKGFLSTPSTDLSIDDQTSMTPLAWLAAGGDPETVVVLAGAVAEIQ